MLDDVSDAASYLILYEYITYDYSTSYNRTFYTANAVGFKKYIYKYCKLSQHVVACNMTTLCLIKYINDMISCHLTLP